MPLNSMDGTLDQQLKRHSSLYHLAGLDGLRALAIIAVLVYHSGMGWMPAGFVGVQVFFVVSGYLITWLLLSEWHSTGKINLKQFWLRRARRLLPALFVMITATLSFAVAFLPEEVAGLRGDVLAAIGYVTNWHLIFAQQSYFDAVGRPSLLQHLWSLAVEEQFYFLWPLLLALILRWRRPSSAWVVAVLGAALSALLMLALYQPDVDPSRVYYGTDTRAAGLLIGAALAFLWQPEIGKRALLAAPCKPAPHHLPVLDTGARKRSRTGVRLANMERGLPLLLDAIGIAGLAILLGAAVAFDEYQPALYFWGLTLVAVTTAIVILVATHPQTRLGSFLDREPLRWIGQRSYGIYLWYWPVFDLTRAHLDVPLDGLALFAMRLVLTVGLAALSFRFIENPIRRGALGRAWAVIRHERGGSRTSVRLRVAGSVASLLVFSIALGASVVNAQPPPPPEYLTELSFAKSADAFMSAGATASAPSNPPTPAAAGLDAPKKSEMAEKSSPPAISPMPVGRVPQTIVAPAQPSPTSAARVVVAVGPETGRAHQVLAIGDSVMLGAVNDLERAVANIEVDAQLGRQVSMAINDLKARREGNHLGDAVVIHVGNNGPFSAKQFAELMGVLAEVPRVVIVNDTVPREWEASNNAMLATVVKKYPNVNLVDWHAESANHPEYFWKDGIHLRPEGAKAYAELVSAALNGERRSPAPG